MVGFGVILFRDVPSLVPFIIVVQNSMIVAGTVFIYAGVKQFFDKKVNLKILFAVVTVFFAGLLFFLFINNDIRIRSAFINATIAFMAFLTAYSLFFDRFPSIAASANFNAAVFILHGSLFAYRTAVICTGHPMDDIFTPSLFNYIPFIDALIVSLLWTFGFIIMVNNRLHVEVSEAKKQLQKIFNTSPDAAVITRLSDGQIVDINDGYTTITGFTRQDIAGKSTREINIWKNSEDRKNVVGQIKETGHCENYEAQFVRKDGVEITGLMSAKLIILQDVPHIISISRDITERKKTEAEIQSKNEELQRLNIEKDKFFSILAHDLRGPFNAFLGFTRIMAEELPSMTLVEIQKIAVSMRKSAINLYRLLDNLLEWSRVQRGVLGFNPVVLTVRTVVNKSLEPVMESSIKKEIMIACDIPEDITITADAHMFETVIRNLVTNAIKYTERGGAINISSKFSNNDFLEISIRDNGIGISPQMHKSIFFPDSSTNRPGTEGEPSTGLGLIICKEFVEKHGGHIWVESEEGAGSTFHFTLKK